MEFGKVAAYQHVFSVEPINYVKPKNYKHMQQSSAVFVKKNGHDPVEDFYVFALQDVMATA